MSLDTFATLGASAAIVVGAAGFTFGLVMAGIAVHGFTTGLIRTLRRH